MFFFWILPFWGIMFLQGTIRRKKRPISRFSNPQGAWRFRWFLNQLSIPAVLPFGFPILPLLPKRVPWGQKELMKKKRFFQLKGNFTTFLDGGRLKEKNYRPPSQCCGSILNIHILCRPEKDVFLTDMFPFEHRVAEPKKKISQNASEMGRKRSFSDVQHVWNICSILSHHYQQGARETGHRTTIASATHWESYAGGGGEAQEEVRCWEVRCWGKNGEKIWKSSLRGPKNAWVSRAKGGDE